MMTFGVRPRQLQPDDKAAAAYAVSTAGTVRFSRASATGVGSISSAERFQTTGHSPVVMVVVAVTTVTVLVLS